MMDMGGNSPLREVSFLDLSYSCQDMETARNWVLDRMRGSTFSYVVTPNVDHVVRLHRAAPGQSRIELWQAYEEADIRFCDSRILALLARYCEVDLPVVAGSDLTAQLLSLSLPAGTRIALVGGSEAQKEWLIHNQPQAFIAHHVPPMGLRSNREAQLAIADFIEEVRPQLTLLTVGAPQSEIVAHLIKLRAKASGVALCVGASLEFLTGEKRRAPKFMQQVRLEWAYRLLSEPRRLWKRYLIEGPAIFLIWLKWRSAATSALAKTNDQAK